MVRLYLVSAENWIFDQNWQRQTHRRCRDEQNQEGEEKPKEVQQFLMRPERLEERTQPSSDERKRENQCATKDSDEDLQARIHAERPCRSQFPARRDPASDGQTSHEARQNQRCRPDGISKGQAAQAQPERFKQERAASGKKEDHRDESDAHGARFNAATRTFNTQSRRASSLRKRITRRRRSFTDSSSRTR